MPTQSYEHLVGAYGVAGFSGVKERPKERPICRRFSVGSLTLHFDCNS